MLTESAEPLLGAPCPAFRLPNVGAGGGEMSREDFAPAKVLVVMFICNHCPYVKAVESRLIRLARDFGPRGVAFVAVCANDASAYPDDAPDKLAERAREREYPFAYLHDETQDAARAFGAVCTPDIFVYDGERRLAYRGRIDDSWKDEALVTKRDLAAALDELLAGRAPAVPQKPTLGCSLKWKAA